MEKESKKEDRRVRRTKKLLTQALTELMQHKQIKDITVTELTELADMNRGTFYLYYRDVFDMVDKIEIEMFTALDQIITPASNEDASSQAKAILIDLFRLIEQNQDVCRVLLSENGDMSFLHRLYDFMREKCWSTWAALRGVQKDEFDYRYSFVVFGCAGLIRAWVNRGCRESAEEMAGLADIMLRRGSLEDS